MKGEGVGRRDLLLGASAILACGPGRSGGGLGLWFAGDVHLDEGDASRIAAVAGATLAGSRGVVNLEGPIADASRLAPAIEAPPGAPPHPRLRNGAGAVKALREVGVAAVGIANNHAADAGPGGDEATAAALRAGGLVPFGGPAGVGVIEGGGVRVVLSAHDLSAGVPLGLVEALTAARAGGDALVATFHVEGPPSYLPRPQLREAVELALAAGAAAVVAHGTHALARVEVRGRAVVAWGLGNLAFGCKCTDEVDGLVLELHVGTDGIEAASLVAIDAGIGGAPAGLARDPGLTFDLLEALGSPPGRRDGHRLWLSLGSSSDVGRPPGARRAHQAP